MATFTALLGKGTFFELVRVGQCCDIWIPSITFWLENRALMRGGANVHYRPPRERNAWCIHRTVWDKCQIMNKKTVYREIETLADAWRQTMNAFSYHFICQRKRSESRERKGGTERGAAPKWRVKNDAEELQANNVKQKQKKTRNKKSTQSKRFV